MKSYLGFCGFYCQFIRDFGQIAKPLTNITRPTQTFIFDKACEEAFDELRQNLLRVQALYHFNPELSTKLETNSSDGVIAGMISQQHSDGNWYSNSFYSHVLISHEVNWEIHDKELYAIVEAFHKWRAELMSVQSRVSVYLDHRSLEYFMTIKILTAKQVRWMEFLTEFNFIIMYTAGKDNQKADILSRKEQDVEAQAQIKQDSRARVLLSTGRLNPRIVSELVTIFVATILTLNVASPPNPPLDSLELVEKLMKDNRNTFQEERQELASEFLLKDGLLLY